MNTDIIAALKAEKQQLKQRITAIDAALVAYGVSAETDSVVVKKIGKTITIRSKKKPEDNQSKSGRVVKAAEAAIRAKGGPITSTALVDILEKQGIKVGGKEARNTVSAILSNSGKFKGKRGVGWVMLDMPDPDSETSPAKLPGM